MQWTLSLSSAVFAVLGAVSVVPLALSGIAQLRTMVVTDATCPGCTVEIRRSLVFGGAGGQLTGRPALFAMDSRGRIYVRQELPIQDPAQAFGSNGAFIGTVGRKGNGPGEVTPTSFIAVGAGDTIHVHSQGRVSMFGPDLSFIRSFTQRTPEISPWSLVTLPSGGTVSTTREVLVRRRDLRAISVRDRQGQLLRTIDLTTGVPPTRQLAVAHPRWKASFWVADSYLYNPGYRLMLLDTLGTVFRTFQRVPSWWTVRKDRIAFGASDTLIKPPTSVRSVREDAGGRALVLVEHPLPNWKAVRQEDEYNGLYETRLEVIDLASGQLIGGVTVMGAPVGILSDDRFATYREDASGSPWLDIWTLTIKSGPG